MDFSKMRLTKQRHQTTHSEFIRNLPEGSLWLRIVTVREMETGNSSTHIAHNDDDFRIVYSVNGDDTYVRSGQWHESITFTLEGPDGSLLSINRSPKFDVSSDEGVLSVICRVIELINRQADRYSDDRSVLQSQKELKLVEEEVKAEEWSQNSDPQMMEADDDDGARPDSGPAEPFRRSGATAAERCGAQ